MSSSSQNGWRTILLTVMTFVVTVSIWQGLLLAVKSARGETWSVSDSRNGSGPASSPVYVENVPPLIFPKSLVSMRDVDFWVPVSMVVRADGGVEKIYVDFQRAVTGKGENFLEKLVEIEGKNAGALTSDVEKALNDVMKGARFKPRRFNGKALPTMVFVDSHFRSKTSSCIEADTIFKTSEGVFWSTLMRSNDHCYDASH